MSTLRTANIQSLSASTPPVIRDSAGTEVGTFCRSWVNFNGTGTVAIRSSFNVSSITDNGVGDYTVNFTNALSDSNYCVICTQGDGTTGAAIPYGLFFNTGGYGKTVSITTSSVRVYSVTYAGGIYDALYNYVSIFR